ncbi:MAG: branched-chain amino acid transaminase [Flavisolibacter sp.]
MYYNEDTVIYYRGEYVKAAEAKGNLFDQSLHYGYAVFEGIRSYATTNGIKIFRAKQHFDRLQFSAEAVGIPYHFQNEELITISYEILKRNGLKNAYIRPLLTASPNMSLTRAKESQLLIAAWEWPALLGEKLLRVRTSSFRRINPASFKVAAKVSGHYVNSIMAAQEARDLGFDEALLLDASGCIAEGPGANIFFEKDGVLYTPALGSILPGITRAVVMELAAGLGIQVVEASLRPEEVRLADSAFFCGTAAEIIGIASLDDKRYSMPWEESLGARLQTAYKDLVLERGAVPETKVA